MDNSSTISIVMSVYNTEKHVGSAILSIIKQTFTDWELVVVDDGSSDNSVKILEEFASVDKRINLLKNNENKGLSYSLNYGISMAKSDLICRMDADDICNLNRLQLQYQYMVDHPDVDLLSGWYVEIDEFNNIIGAPHCPEELNNDSVKLKETLIKYNVLVHPATIFKKDIFMKVKGYRTIFKGAVDYDLWLRMSEVGKIARTSDVVLFYRRHKDSVTIKNNPFVELYANLARKCYQIRSRGLPDEPFIERFGEISGCLLREMNNNKNNLTQLDVMEITIMNAQYFIECIKGGIMPKFTHQI